MKILCSTFATLLFLEVLIKCVHGQEDCNPYTNCENAEPGSKVPDPNDCRSYYVCIEEVDGKVVPSDNSYKCDLEYYFNYNYASCKYGTCTNTCLNICELECTTYEYERVADPTDCSTFYTCRPGGIKFKDHCPTSAPFFDGTTCNTNIFSCCDSCVSYCKKAFTEVIDPYDCRSYYTCSATGIPSETDKYPCPEDEFFDPTIGKCTYEDLNSPCTPLCSSVEPTAKSLPTFVSFHIE